MRIVSLATSAASAVHLVIVCTCAAMVSKHGECKASVYTYGTVYSHTSGLYTPTDTKTIASLPLLTMLALSSTSVCVSLAMSKLRRTQHRSAALHNAQIACETAEIVSKPLLIAVVSQLSGIVGITEYIATLAMFITAEGIGLWSSTHEETSPRVWHMAVAIGTFLTISGWIPIVQSIVDFETTRDLPKTDYILMSFVLLLAADVFSVVSDVYRVFAKAADFEHDVAFFVYSVCVSACVCSGTVVLVSVYCYG